MEFQVGSRLGGCSCWLAGCGSHWASSSPLGRPMLTAAGDCGRVGGDGQGSVQGTTQNRVVARGQVRYFQVWWQGTALACLVGGTCPTRPA